jgi:enoyl-[acyl-carrier protein] reductase/trans-2-enoyl-CoA reductase (NAD+)
MVITPKIRGFICLTAHPEGCAAQVQQQIDYVKKCPPLSQPPKKVLIIGASTGYGLASRIASAFGARAATLGLFFEKAAENGRPASAGWYNTAAFEKAAQAEGLYAKSLNGDAFSDALKQQAIEIIKKDLGQIDLVIYSLASPRRTHPKTGVVYKSCLKPTGTTFTAKTVNTDNGTVHELTIEPANEQEIADTTQVMGGEDWSFWIEALQQAGVLAPQAVTVAYSYIGPKITSAIYREGTIGKAKEDIENTAHTLNEKLKASGGKALISVNKALVTQASSAIPVVPLYVSLLYKVMKEKGLHEGCIEQIQRLFSDHLFSGKPLQLDDVQRIRLDDWEMKQEVQEAVEKLWPQVTTENLKALSDFNGYQEEFLKLFGFKWPGVDYAMETNPEVAIPSLS